MCGTMFPNSVIAFALGLYYVAVWGRSLVNYGSEDVLILSWGKEQYLFAWAEVLLLLGVVGAIKVLLLALFLCQQEVVNSLHVGQGRRFTWVLEGPVVQYLLG